MDGSDLALSQGLKEHDLDAIKSMTVIQLKGELRKHSQKVSGTKAQLQERLRAFLEQDAANIWEEAEAQRLKDVEAELQAQPIRDLHDQVQKSYFFS